MWYIWQLYLCSINKKSPVSGLTLKTICQETWYFSKNIPAEVAVGRLDFREQRDAALAADQGGWQRLRLPRQKHFPLFHLLKKNCRNISYKFDNSRWAAYHRGSKLGSSPSSPGFDSQHSPKKNSEEIYQCCWGESMALASGLWRVLFWHPVLQKSSTTANFRFYAAMPQIVYELEFVH